MQPLPADTLQENGRLNRNLFGSEFTSMTILMFPFFQDRAAESPEYEFLRDIWHIVHVLGRLPTPSFLIFLLEVDLFPPADQILSLSLSLCVCVCVHPNAASCTSPSGLTVSAP